MKIVHYYANSCFDWLIYGQQSDNALREATSRLSGKYKRFAFVHPVHACLLLSRDVLHVLGFETDNFG